MVKNLQSFFFFGAFIVLISSCTLDDPGTTPSNFPLTLQAEQDFSLIHLHWAPVKVTGFKEYILLQSSTEIPSSPEPTISSEISIVKRIDDSDVTTFTTSDILFSENVCYKLYVCIDDRFIQSNNVCIEQDFKLLEGFYDRAGHEKGSDDVIMFDRVNRNLSVYNLSSGEITSTITENLSLNLKFSSVRRLSLMGWMILHSILPTRGYTSMPHSSTRSPMTRTP